MSQKFFSLALFLTSLATAAQPYPETPMVPFSEIYHGVEVADPYQWLENSMDPCVKAWDQAQNACSQEYFDENPHILPCFQHFNKLYAYETTSINVGDSEKILTIFCDPEEEQPILYLQKDADHPQQELFNPNTYSKNTHIEQLSFSYDGAYLSLSVTQGGNETPEILILNLETLNQIKEPLKGWRHGDVVWHPSEQGFFYIAFPIKGTVAEGDEYFYPSVFYHRIGKPSKKDTIVQHDSENKTKFYFLHSYGDQLLITSLTYTELLIPTIEQHLIPFDNMTASPELIYSQAPGECIVLLKEINNTNYYITNYEAPNFRILIEKDGNYYDFIPESKKIIQSMCALGKFIAVTYLVDGHTEIKLFNSNGQFVKKVPLPENGIATILENNEEPNTYIIYESLTHPSATYSYSAKENLLKPFHSPYESYFDSKRYEVTFKMIKSLDGTAIPLYLAHKKNLKLNGKNPVLIDGYGGFDVPHLPVFQQFLTPWLEANGIIAIPCLRGGGEYANWHEQGSREFKQNTFDDCIAVAEWLVKKKYTSPSQLAVMGSSNGGLLTGAVMTQRPDLFRAVISGFPVLDMIRYPNYYMGMVWEGEYGSPHDAQMFSTLLQYSPYHNVKDNQVYPSTLIYGGQNDLRIHPMHIRKMTARLQNASPGGNPILMYLDPAVGHVPSSFKSAQNIFSRYVGFLMQELEMSPAESKKEKRSLLIDNTKKRAAELQLRRSVFHTKDDYLQDVQKQTKHYHLKKMHQNRIKHSAVSFKVGDIPCRHCSQ